MRYQKPKGTADILPGESEKWQYVESVAQNVFSRYRFSEIRTPIFESYEVFERSSGDTSDIVSKEMYDFKDKGDRHIALRPEGTAGVVRAYVENKLYGPEYQRPYKVWYKGPMFRYERPQSGRQRQFHQIGLEAFGSDSPELDVEIISVGLNFLNELGVHNLKVAINTLGDPESRENYHKALVDYFTPFKDQLSDDSKVRLEKNPLRILDSKDENDKKFVADAPSILDYLNDASRERFEYLKSLLDDLDINYVVDPTMVRGLDYYNHTIFEFMVTDPAFNNKEITVLAGGRYNGLVEELGGKPEPGIGFGLGMERLMLLLKDEDIHVENNLDVYLVTIGDAAERASVKILSNLRRAGFSADKDYLQRKTKAQFKTADRLDAKYTVTIGDAELENDTANVKNMATGEQVSVSLENLAEELKKIEG
ncbi:histidine--tRNA ligase [Companilactobacillus nodensis]|uniref:Histidine--tRNA ligase n=1 Tax=Companilactobacillus nodensis DSM 19682 = JCM 14932 = NBRC 107160 TaxID=1423775 RepID=A0A0R1KAH1_9LACO|nr:histidine--tRNA ligase [Companilactobacillus nodensis]KRK80460.1 histidyl-tRNA synthetase [Companilactobacillus nodensis DSM 19682 = JCM 14932 = NBRC 107160]